jgi:hypothetical protein
MLMLIKNWASRSVGKWIESTKEFLYFKITQTRNSNSPIETLDIDEDKFALRQAAADQAE